MTRPIKNLSGSTATGDGTHVGTNDIDQLNNLLSGQDQSTADPSLAVSIATNWAYNNTKLRLKSPTTSKNFVVNTSDIVVDRNVTLPILSGDDTITFNAQTQTLTNKTLTTPTITGSGGTLTLPAGPDTFVARATTDTLTNKTLTSPVISSISNSGTLTLPTGPDTLTGRATTDTLTNKTFDYSLNTPLNATNRANGTFYLAGSNYKFMNWGNGLTTTNTDFSVLANAVMTSFSATGGYFTFLGHLFTLKNPISVPTAFDSNPFIFQGVRSAVRQKGTTFLFDTAFPTTRGAFECISTIGSGNSVCIHASDMYFYNANPNRTDAATFKIDIDAFVIEGDRTGSLATVDIERIFTQNMRRSINLKGGIYNWTIKDCTFTDYSSTFLFDADIRCEVAGHDIPSGKTPRTGYIENIFATHAGLMNSSLYFDTVDYTNVNRYFIDGVKYAVAPYYFSAANTLCCTDLKMEDLNTASPSGVLGSLVLDNTSFENQFFACGIQNMNNATNPYTVAFLNGSHDNFVQCMHYGGIPNINDASSYNYVEMIGDTNPASNLKLLSTSGFANIRVTDRRKGARAKGLSATQSGDASTLVFNIAHGCFAAPVYAMAHAASTAAIGSFKVTSDATNIIVTYPAGSAPASGSNNLQWYYSAEVYA